MNEKLVQFNFSVSEKESEDIFGCISQEICHLRDESYLSTEKVDAEWYEKRIEYLQALKNKMHNSRGLK